ncbi:NERD domain-containing protein [Streptomyces sp. FXJ1.172]|uniref:nuclease-related domain-containing DEAD/DEAH box helicase n=1 Tax=Streptomyces sp. FXJ1.172 TaxID=710705 RepID=UPI00099FC265|nr:NERD domain-containing protein/DEAD/DEAH box helicase [Streptomyces sp. FXJ1.172]WEO97179.1 NERD domain-containing protein [Streptomyces sp. FXJ1.172]
MARMIPPSFNLDDTPSPGEREFFERLRDDPGTEGWIALHSLGIAEHPRQIRGEADFVVIVPGEGIVFLELKAHRTASRLPDGRWRLGSQPPTERSPFKQAEEAMYGLAKYVNQVARDIPMVPAVGFTHAAFTPPRSPEWHSWQFFDSTAFHRQPVSALILRILRNWRRHLASTNSAKGWFQTDVKKPTVNQSEQILQKLRPSFDFAEPPRIRRYRRETEAIRFTEEQFQLLDAIFGNPRCLATGPAGTGKTFIALEAARRMAAAGKNVLFCCYNRLLGDWLESETAGDRRITAGTLHGQLRHLAGHQKHPVPERSAARRSYFEEELPEAALAVLLDDELTPQPPYDVLVLDEAQDLMTDHYLDVFDASLRGGLSAGTWFITGDFTNQAIFGTPGGGLELLRNRAPFLTSLTLGKNCRNVPAVAQYVETSSRLDPGYAGYLRPENGRERVQAFWRDDGDQLALLEQHLTRLLNDGFDADEIIVLSPLSSQSAAQKLSRSQRWSHRLGPVGKTAPRQIPYASVGAYKGLDAAAVVVTDFDGVTGPREESLFYIATSRARDDLTVLASREAREDLRRLVLGE